MKYKHKLLLLLSLLLIPPAGAVAGERLPECRDMKTVEAEYTGPERFEEGILWRVSRAGMKDSHVFGTIHVGDEAIVNIPDKVDTSLRNSDHFVMEAMPDMEQSAQLSGMMFFQDGRRLNEMVSESMFNRIAGILQSYHLPENAIPALKPWAAFVTMSYPADMRKILDLELMQIAAENGIQVHGLETLVEQGRLFNQLAMENQLRLLADTVCHYETVQKDFEVMKSLYLERDLKGLYVHGQSHAFNDNSIYESLTKRILHERNHTMVERMQPLLEKGNAFIAIGAMHLPGEEGVLNLLHEQGYTVSRIH